MLVIRDAQWRAFEREAVLAGALRAHPDEVAATGLEPFCARVEAAMDRAEGHGLSAPEALSRFVALDLLLGAGFDQELPWARKVLGWSQPADERLSALERKAEADALRRAGLVP